MDANAVYERMLRGWLELGGGRSHVVAAPRGAVHVLELEGGGALPTVALLHGFSASAASQYAAMARLLRPHVSRLLLPDLPGHGESAVPQGGLDALALYEGLAHVLEACCPEPAILFASSMAGGLAIRYARERPSQVAALMLCSPSGAPLTDEEHLELQRLFRPHDHAEAVAFVARLFPEERPIVVPRVMRHLYAWGSRRQFARPHLLALLEAAPRSALRPEDLSGLSMPVSLLWGGADRILPASHLEFFRRWLPPHAAIDTPACFGHAPFLDQPEALAERLLRFAERACAERRAVASSAYAHERA